MKKIIELIEKYEKIIIARHVLPDLDALGSQYGLKSLILKNYPNKKVYAVGTEIPNKYSFVGNIDNLEKDDYKNSLFISVDTATLKLLDSECYELSETRIKIDHHATSDNFFENQYVDTSMESNCSIIVELAKYANWEFDKTSATLLMNGIVSDSGRFLYSSTTKETFERAAFLMNFEIDLEKLYRNQYVSTVKQKKLESYVLQNFSVKNNVAYIIYEENVMNDFDVNLAYLKSGTVNMMSNLEGIDAWMTFTKVDGKVMVELRGYKPVVEVCKKHGGGGHLLACGCTINGVEIEDFINEVIEVVKC